MPKHETRNLGSKDGLVMKFRQFIVILQNKIFVKKYYENIAYKLVPGTRRSVC